MHPDAWPAFAAAVEAFTAGEYARAAAGARAAAAADTSSLLATAAAVYLERLATKGKEGVYISGEAFGTFIRGGGNLPLYAAVSAALREIYAEQRGAVLLDVGVGDGLALLPALTPAVARVDLVEPSAQMLARATADLAARTIPFRAFPLSIQELAGRAHPEARWALAQATFSLQSVPPDERRAALAWLRAHAGRLLIAEFDPPAFADDRAPARLAHIAARYEQGLAEYAGDGGLVAQGFLMPVLFGNFDPTAARTNYEQPIAAWEEDLRAAGFTRVARRHLYDYWWTPAYLLDAG